MTRSSGTSGCPGSLLGALVGAGLAVVGCALQAVVRNPLADPYLLGSHPVRRSARSS